MAKATAALVGLLAIALTAGCGSAGPVRASGSTDYFFAQLEYADASADYFTLPVSLADTLPNRTYKSRAGAYDTTVSFSWTQRVVVGRVTEVSSADQHRIRLRIRIEESFPATDRGSVDVLVAGSTQDEKRYLASAASLDRIVIGIDNYRDDDGDTQTVAAMASQLIGVVDGKDQVSYPVLGRQDFTSAGWDQNMTTLADLRREATASPSTIEFGRG